MKEIINVEVKSHKVDLSNCKTDLLAIGLFADTKGLDKPTQELNSKLKGAIDQLIKLGDFKGKDGTSALIYGNEQIGAKRVLLVGLGEKQKATLDTVRKAAANTTNKAVEMKIKTVSLALHRAFGGRFDLTVMGRAMTEGVYFGSYRYDEFVTESKNERLDTLSVELIDTDSTKTRKLNQGLSNGATIGKTQSYARTLANRPGNVINPATLAAEASKLARGLKGLSCTVFDEKQLTAKGMGGVLAVGSGSKNPPRFIILKYQAGSKAARKLPVIGLVGKAITFDSGGISIKRAANMDQMKLDKSGGIAVLGTMKAAAELKLPINVYGIIPAAENMPSGTSYRPGDIITTFSGKTVEVLDTDAEGRMVLCDGLAYAVKQKCDIIIDIGTLTGACKVALGKHMAGLMGNDEKLIKQIQGAAQDSGEKVWHMPSGEEYLAEMKSNIADLRNLAYVTKYGDACGGAAFLGQFVGDAKWAHLDIAGVDIFEKATKFMSEGSSGFGVRLLTTFLMNLTGKKG
ncbi:MAG: leucyl aminopeptidase [Planctomycetota bacterium]|nr:MAG: leucyl aminopeptidase [Planctomycetota bacterium]